MDVESIEMTASHIQETADYRETAANHITIIGQETIEPSTKSLYPIKS